MTVLFNAHIRSQDQKVFQEVAHRENLFIIVRQTNPASLQYIGKPGYSPKRAECKPKTADYDLPIRVVEGTGYVFTENAGLVVNPYLVGPKAFKNHDKYQKSCQAWDSFANKNLFPHSPHYGVQEDPRSRHYGCVIYSKQGQIKNRLLDNQGHWVEKAKGSLDRDPYLPAGCEYIHGDYDLYGIISADDPTTNLIQENKIAVRQFEAKPIQTSAHRIDRQQKTAFVPNNHGQEWEKVKRLINQKIGVEMIQHGSQEKFSGHTDETLDMFTPNKKMVVIRNQAHVELIYQIAFKNRRTQGEIAKLTRVVKSLSQS